MHPDNQTPDKPLYVPPRQMAPLQDRQGRPAEPIQTAAANVARNQLDAIYANDPNAQMPAPEPSAAPQQQAPPQVTQEPAEEQRAEPLPTISRSFTPEAETPNPYKRTHDETSLHTDQAAWQAYHSAWQNYYQQYFHRYYAGHLHDVNTKLAEQAARVERLAIQPVEQTPEEALTDLRSQIRHKVKTTTKKVRKSRHFVPAIAACIVMLVFAFLQYNAVLFANVEAYINPASNEPTNFIVSPSSTVAVDENPRLLIPKIAVDVPIVWDATPDHDSQMRAMKDGVAWFNIRGASARPGQVGNTVLSGHSSNDVFDDGNYKFVFARLEQLKKSDTFYINYQGVRYTYVVSKIRIVTPKQVDALTEPTDKPIVTLITCTPLGTAEKRFLVTGEQISPNPKDAAIAEDTSGANDATMPGSAPTFFERLFGAN